ncbi:hypothetical protein JTE90_001338 [Oedothorax gibbosus]|uniref:Uncharacterized protein n=1 Tax=Oedothorax gibbosus TaxID=931172 RepID=A0AAV6V2Z9_9ARAC|nr:hypothetical protein JTE90_001338 [Oedothorax gibbosus]
MKSMEMNLKFGCLYRQILLQKIEFISYTFPSEISLCKQTHQRYRKPKSGLFKSESRRCPVILVHQTATPESAPEIWRFQEASSLYLPQISIRLSEGGISGKDKNTWDRCQLGANVQSVLCPAGGLCLLCGWTRRRRVFGR